MRKKIKKGEHVGLTEITEATMLRKDQQMIADSIIPTEEVPVLAVKVRTGQNCQGGMEKNFDAIDQCQHFFECGMCVDPSRMQTSVTRHLAIDHEERLDEVAYRRLQKSN